MADNLMHGMFIVDLRGLGFSDDQLAKLNKTIQDATEKFVAEHGQTKSLRFENLKGLINGKWPVFDRNFAEAITKQQVR